MKTAKAIAKANQAYDKQIKTLFAKLKQQINDLPDNPRIKRLGNSGQCFTVMSSDLFRTYGTRDENGKPKGVQCSNWTPEFYDFKKQYELIIAELEKVVDPRNIIKRLNQILDEEYIRVRPSMTAYRHRINPDVISNIRSLL